MRVIDADDALEFLNLMYDNQEDKDDPYNVGVMGAINYIKHKAPSIDIVRCKNCKKKNHCGRSMAAKEEGFCSDAE